MTSFMHMTIGCGGAATWLWLAWRSVRTGMPAGNPRVNPRREERPIYFWSVVAFFTLYGLWTLARTFDPAL